MVKGWPRILTQVLGIRVATRPTEGPSENIRLIEDGQAQIGFVTMGVAQQGWNGMGDWTQGKQYRAMRALFPMYDTPFHFIVMQDKGAHSSAELAGNRLGVGPQGGTSATYTPKLLATLKLDAHLSYGTWADLTMQLAEGELDGFVVAAGVPFPAVADLEAKNKVRYVPLTPDQILLLRLAIPELNASLIPPAPIPL